MIAVASSQTFRLVPLECSLCVPNLAGNLTTICEQHLLEINRQPGAPLASCDVCEPKPDDRITTICPRHLRELVGGGR